MNRFSDFNITTDFKGFEGEKIRMFKILNRQVIVHDFKIEDSKVKEFREKGTEKCLHLQISIDGIKRVVFTSSTWLIEKILEVPKDGFPFSTTIIQDDKRFLFT